MTTEQYKHEEAALKAELRSIRANNPRSNTMDYDEWDWRMSQMEESVLHDLQSLELYHG